MINVFSYLVKHPADWEKSSGSFGKSWWIAFHANGEHEFTGTVIHLHIATPDDWVPIINDLRGWAKALTGIAKVAGILTSVAAAIAIPAVALAWEICTNTDGTYDFFAIRESATWLESLNPMTIDFMGFVSDAWHKPPLSIDLGNLLPVFQYSGVRRVAAAYRDTPKPSLQLE